MGITLRAQRLQQLRWPHAHAPGALDQGLSDEGRQTVAVGVEEGRHIGLGRGQPGRPATEVGAQLPAGILRHVQPLAGQQQGAEEARHEVLKLAHAHGPQGVAVVAAAQGAEAVTALLAPLVLGLEGHLQGHLHGGAAIVREEGAGQAGGQAGPQAGHQFQGRLVGEAGEHRMVQLADLALQGTHQARVAVPMEAGPPAGDAVQHPLTVGQQEVAALAAHHGHRRIGLVDLHLREGMPDMGPVQGQAIRPVRGQGRGHGSSVRGLPLFCGQGLAA